MFLDLYCTLFIQINTFMVYTNNIKILTQNLLQTDINQYDIAVKY